ncbi:hypothetical protein Kpol_1036p94 [Vanderwaltozyma polyspora DSM 70294]|uniref:Protein STB3 n=1 Tax=Vanderwaltozyma polyspora (strain ATCC 22028 / DSM 70294 / BCRC 21397 / CBS 2163 / NBRC 10782 / NRRL Y-8283 / UCD 57-17) TaxID=436907 RepID=A7TEP0_VANPO|nr:uncharacterized protein Kpol_1036p94 [Vanderwaltozyma polyspora DSM 70294]EDO19347.1 hypothetical protein Kpol_1036p94 [Vanderwaltozyma polyspora DSM 70294]
MNNEQEVTIKVEQLSRLLLSNGPLAIRYINNYISGQDPNFKKLSTSKQRRLILNVLQAGDKDKSVIFEKIGWGLWNAKVVKPEDFIKEREAMNIANAKVKDEHRKSSNDKHVLLQPSKTTYIDENALASDDEDDEVSGTFNDTDDILLNYDDIYSQRSKKTANLRRTSVVSVESPPESLKHEILAQQKLKPFMKSHRKSSTSSPQPITGESRRESRLSVSKESSIRSTLLPNNKNYQFYSKKSNASNDDNLIKLNNQISNNDSINSNYQEEPSALSDTDEEDWASIGAQSLRNTQSPIIRPTNPSKSKKSTDDSAALLLLSLKS